MKCTICKQAFSLNGGPWLAVVTNTYVINGRSVATKEHLRCSIEADRGFVRAVEAMDEAERSGVA